MKTKLSKPPDELRKAFAVLSKPEDVATLLEVPYQVLIYHLYRTPETTRYTSFNIPKRSGGARTINAPATTLKLLQRKLNHVLQLVYVPKPSVQGFVFDRSVVTNAGKHTLKRHILNIDLQDFFPSINFGRVRGMFKAKPYSLPSNVATLLAQLCCFQNQLPQGAPTSPTVANMVCSRLDSRFQRLAKTYRCTYTRYADDITISTTKKRFPDVLGYLDDSILPPKLILGKEILQAVSENGFAINIKKARLQLPHNRHAVTGITSNQFPNLQRSYFDHLRAMLHDWKKSGLKLAEQNHISRPQQKHRHQSRATPSFRQVVRGKLNYIGMVRGVEDPMFIRYARQLAGLDTEYAAVFQHKIQTLQDSSDPSNAVWVLEGSNSQGTAFFLNGVGFVTCAHAVESDTVAFRTNLHTKTFPIKSLARDVDMDLAILQIDVENPVTLRKGNSDKVAIGDPITLLGFPNYSVLGQSIQKFSGRITGTKTLFERERIMIDAPIIGGNSGGPILNSSNEVIGVAFRGADRLDKKFENEFGATPINLIEILHTGALLK